MGFHKWVRIRETDPTVDNPSQSAEWRSVCRRCKAERGSGVLAASIVSAVAFVAGVVLLWFAPLLGAIFIIGSMYGLLVGVVPASTERVARWLSR